MAFFLWHRWVISLFFFVCIGPKAVWRASSPPIFCYFWEMSGKCNLKISILSFLFNCYLACHCQNFFVYLCNCLCVHAYLFWMMWQFVLCHQVGSDSIIGAMCQVADKTSIKRSTVGNSTIVKEKVKVANSIIMHGVTIEEGWEHTHLFTLFKDINFKSSTLQGKKNPAYAICNIVIGLSEKNHIQTPLNVA